MNDADPAVFSPDESSAEFADIYRRLKAMASRHRLHLGSPKTLCTTELVHEAFMKMEHADYQHQHEGQYFAYAARAMRHILIDAARRRIQPMRGGDQARLTLTDPAVNQIQVDPHLALQLDDALTALADEAPRAAQVVELHFFAGLDMHSVADVLNINRRTVNRDWRYARAFLAARASD